MPTQARVNGIGTPIRTQSQVAIAVLIPCRNEALTVTSVVKRFRAALPSAQIYVYDNCSSDDTSERARKAGALVRRENQPGKGCVVRRMFSDIEADVYVLVDGDDTYEAEAAHALIAELLSGPFDLVNGDRLPATADAHPQGHLFGNKILNALINQLFGTVGTDMLSGYKVLSRRFVKTFPTMSSGFEIETELVVHALQLRMPTSAVKTSYSKRKEGSISKLHAFRDGLRIVKLLSRLVKEERPLLFFATIGCMLACCSLLLSPTGIIEYDPEHLPLIFAEFLALALGLSAILSVFSGLILDTVTRGRRELKRLHYLTMQAPSIPPSELQKTEAALFSARNGNGRLGQEGRYEPGQSREYQPVGIAKFGSHAENQKSGKVKSSR